MINSESQTLSFQVLHSSAQNYMVCKQTAPLAHFDFDEPDSSVCWNVAEQNTNFSAVAILYGKRKTSATISIGITHSPFKRIHAIRFLLTQ